MQAYQEQQLLKTRNHWIQKPGWMGLLLTVLSLMACSNSSTETGTEQSKLEAVNDPLLTQQWGLRNTGQTAYATYGGTPGEDMNAWQGSTLSVAAYAGGMTGKGVALAILDSGLEIRHEDLVENIVKQGSYNFVEDNNDPTNQYDEGDHGTAVAGLAGARGGNGKGLWGVAPAVSLYGFNLLQDTRFQSELAALGEASALGSYPNLKSSEVAIFNRSYGVNPYQEIPPSDYHSRTLPVMQALESGTQKLRSGKGALYIKAAGNEFSGGALFSSGWCQQAIAHQVTCYNANMETENSSPFQIVVGAFNAQGKRASYSNTGSSLWVVAPGGEGGEVQPAMVTTDMSGCNQGYSRSVDASLNAFNRGEVTENENCQYFSALNGTSSATPMVSGAVALILEANPNLTWREVKWILAKTARKLDPQATAPTLNLSGQTVALDSSWVTNAAGFHFSNAYGFGAVDILAAVQMAKQWRQAGTSLPSFQSLNPKPQTVNQIVPDNNPNGLESQKAISKALTAETVTVTVTLKALTTSNGLPAIDNSDYQILLISPSGTTSTLLTPFSAYQSGHEMNGLRLTSNAFLGESITGNWRLIVRDLDGSTANRLNHRGEGKLTEWSIEFTGH